MPSPLTMRDAARRLGVSPMMISRALNNKPDISAEKRAWILAEIAHMGYRIHPYVRCSMAARRTRQSAARHVPLALLNLWQPATALAAAPAYRDMLAGCTNRARELGYRVDIFSPRDAGMSTARLDKILQSRGICGILVPPLPTPLGHLRLEWDRYSAIAMGFTLRYPDLHRVTCNPAQAMQTILHHLKNSSYKRIGLVITESAERRLNSFNTGSFLSWQNARIGKERRLPICRIASNPKKAVKQWLARHRPDAVILQSSHMANWINEAGFSFPADIGVAVLDLYEEDAGKHGFDFSGTYFGNNLLGAKSVEMLTAQVERHELGIPAASTVLMVPPQWHAGTTIR